MNSHDIPKVPQFLLQDADRHHVPAVAAEAEQRDETCHGEISPPPAASSDLDLPADEEAEIFGQPAEISLPPAPPLVAPSAQLPAASAGSYSAADLSLFRSLTGYHLDIRSRLPRAMDDGGNRAAAMDRLFTTLSEEAFKLADRHRRMSSCPDRDLTIDDLAASLAPVRRAAAAIGSRGLMACETLEAAVARLKATDMARPILPEREAVAA